jgi:hypothetical protein
LIGQTYSADPPGKAKKNMKTLILASYLFMKKALCHLLSSSGSVEVVKGAVSLDIQYALKIKSVISVYALMVYTFLNSLVLSKLTDAFSLDFHFLSLVECPLFTSRCLGKIR